MQTVSSLTVDLVETYHRCSPSFEYVAQPVLPPRLLTKPSEPSVPGGYDNINDDLIVSVNDVLVSSLGIRLVNLQAVYEF